MGEYITLGQNGTLKKGSKMKSYAKSYLGVKRFPLFLFILMDLLLNLNAYKHGKAEKILKITSIYGKLLFIKVYFIRDLKDSLN